KDSDDFADRFPEFAGLHGVEDTPARLQRKAFEKVFRLVALAARDEAGVVVQTADESDAEDLNVALPQKLEEVFRLVTALAVFAVADEHERVQARAALGWPGLLRQVFGGRVERVNERRLPALHVHPVERP